MQNLLGHVVDVSAVAQRRAEAIPVVLARFQFLTETEQHGLHRVGHLPLVEHVNGVAQQGGQLARAFLIRCHGNFTDN